MNDSMQRLSCWFSNNPRGIHNALWQSRNNKINSWQSLWILDVSTASLRLEKASEVTESNLRQQHSLKNSRTSKKSAPKMSQVRVPVGGAEPGPAELVLPSLSPRQGTQVAARRGCLKDRAELNGIKEFGQGFGLSCHWNSHRM